MWTENWYFCFILFLYFLVFFIYFLLSMFIYFLIYLGCVGEGTTAPSETRSVNHFKPLSCHTACNAVSLSPIFHLCCHLCKQNYAIFHPKHLLWQQTVYTAKTSYTYTHASVFCCYENCISRDRWQHACCDWRVKWIAARFSVLSHAGINHNSTLIIPNRILRRGIVDVLMAVENCNTFLVSELEPCMINISVWTEYKWWTDWPTDKHYHP